MKKLVTVITMALLLSACMAPRPQLPPAPDAAVLLQTLAESGERWQQLDAAAKVGFTRNGHYLPSNQFVLLEKPDRIRVDVLTFFGQLAMQLAVDRNVLQVYLNTTVPGQFYRGPASEDLFARFIHLPLRAPELVQLLLYDPPHSGTPDSVVEVTADRYLLRLDDGDRRQLFYFDASLRLRRCVYLFGGQVLLSVAYDKLDSADGFPRSVKLEAPEQKTRVTLALSEVKLNQPARAGRFELSPPANAVPLQLPPASGEGGHS